jgi:Divergent InlB B-repeat domain
VRRLVFVAALGVGMWFAPGALASGWCGNGEQAADRAETVTGQQIHAVVVMPSDQPDNFVADANRLADDAASMSSWWTGQDPTRVPRFDLAAYPAAPCLDVSFLRLAEPAAGFQGASLSFRLVLQGLQNAGFVSRYKIYYVYFDGPSVEKDVCGTGGGTFDSGPAYAVIWLAGCPSVPTDSIGTHELLHALGALPAGAPHACTAETDPFGVADPGHPCDSPTDILYPAARDGELLTQQVLDYGHDDYYAHDGSWPDIQDSVFLRHLDTPQVALSLLLSGPGRVQSDLPGIDCTSSCTTQWDQGSAVTLTATPQAGSRFVHWAGSCFGRADCHVGLGQAASTTAVFGPTAISVRVRTAGKGHVVCTPACSRSFVAGNPLALRAVPARGWKFTAWTGACKGRRRVCSPATDFPLSIRATFTKA